MTFNFMHALRRSMEETPQKKAPAPSKKRGRGQKRSRKKRA